MGQEQSTIDPALLVAQTGWVQMLARSLVRDHDGAEDVAQETLLAAWSAPPNDVADVRRLRAWLGRVAYNLAHLSMRRNVRRRAREERAARGERQDSAAESIVRNSVTDLVVEAVTRLPEPYRTAVVLRYFEGLPSAEVARRMETTESAVRKRLWRARRKLRRELDAMHNGERQAWFSALVPFVLPPASSGGAGLPKLAKLASWKAAAAVPLAILAVAAGTKLFVDVAGGSLEPVETIATLPVVGESFSESRVRVEVGPELDASSRGEAAVRNRPRVRFEILPLRITEPVVENTAFLLRGSVIDLEGNPLGGVGIALANDPAKPLGRSGANGDFSVSVRSLPQTLVPVAPGYAAVGTAHVRRGEQGWHQWLLAAPAVDLSGGVFDEHGYPVAGATVEVVCAEEAFVNLPVPLDATRLEPARSTTNEAGGFELGRVVSGHGVLLRASHPAYETQVRPVPDHSDVGLQILLARRAGPWLELAGRVVDEAGEPIAGARVTFDDFEARTDAEGTFSLGVTDTGRDSSLVASKPGFMAASVRGLGRKLGAGSLPDWITVTLEDGSESISGRVLDEDGEPLSGWIVNALAQDEDGPKPDEGADTDVLAFGVSSGNDGTFDLAGLGADDYELVALDPETLLATAPLRVRAGTTDVELRAETDHVYGELPGRVVRRDGLPLPGARVRLVRSLPAARGAVVACASCVNTDSRGRFVLNDVPMADVEIQVEHPAAEDTAVAPAPPGTTGSDAAQEIVVEPLRSFRLQGFDGADSLVLLDGAGRELALAGPLGRTSRGGLHRGRSVVYSTTADMAVLVWYRNGREVARRKVSLPLGSPIVLDPD